MNLKDSICKFIKKSNDRTVSKPIDRVQLQTSEKEEKTSSKLNPRDGMSLESAKFAIDLCTGNSQYEIHSLKNKGRYFTAKIMDSKGKQVNELLVDKLNGRVRFLR